MASQLAILFISSKKYPVTNRKETKSLIIAPKSKFSLLFGLVGLLYTKQAQCNEGCAKLNYSLPEVKYRISANSFHGNYSFLNLPLCPVTRLG